MCGGICFIFCLGNKKTYGETAKRRFLHLVRRFIADSQDGDVVAGGEKLFGKVKANDGVTAAVGVDYKYILLLCLNGESLSR